MCVQTIEPPTEECRCYVVKLKVMVALHIIFGLLQLTTSVFTLEGIISFIIAYFVCMSMRMLLAMPLVSVIFFSFYFAVNFAQYFLVPVQNAKPFSLLQLPDILFLSLAIVSCAFNIFCMIFYYFPYKCFRTINHLITPVPSQENNNNLDKQEIAYNPYSVKSKEQPNFKPFEGKGVRIG